MRYALAPDLTEATKGATGTCPDCSAAVIAKCGALVEHHWAHARGADCDRWAEPMSAWHREWQNQVPAHFREVRMGAHRADVITPSGHVFEVQHSTLAATEIRARERFYGSMTWIWDAREAWETDRLELRIPKGRQDNYRTFRWKHPRRSIAVCRARVLLDLGPNLLMLGRLFPDAPAGGYGWLIPRAEVIGRMNHGTQAEAVE